ncbi:MAG: hypothetical protein GY795_04755 [Desulfobacterales bacterium]|nr:hypothetical protein [Desulfobacterales bacterium]
MSEPNVVSFNFKECTLLKLEKNFGLKEVLESQVLQDWLAGESDISEFERQTLINLRKKLKLNVHDWNETELAHYFIGPLLTLVDYTTDRFNLFAERFFSGVVDGIEMKGRPDGIIATGLREPEKPFFCFQEYKKEQYPEGDPAAQTLGAMLVAQEINEHKHPVYGCFVRGRDWFFMVLHGKHYCIAEPYIATRNNDIFNIYKILSKLKQMILKITNERID